MNASEIEQAANLLACAYYDDVFFKWCVDDDNERHAIVAGYYQVYLRSRGCMAHVAESSDMGIIGASVWLPHDCDAGIYEEIERVVGASSAPMFRAVAEKSHLSEPPMKPFYQLVGFGTSKQTRRMGVGRALLEYCLNILDEAGIPTYLEASTPYTGGGIYGKFGYQPVGELMVFTDNAVLHPLWRPAKAGSINFGEFSWRVLFDDGASLLLLAENVLELKKYHDTFEKITWDGSDIKKYLNNEFLTKFSADEQNRITEIFLLSVEEVLEYLGGAHTGGKFYVDDSFNSLRAASYIDTMPCRWYLRTPGSTNDFIAVVMIDGRISICGDFVNRESTELFKVGMRPAMWVKKWGELL